MLEQNYLIKIKKLNQKAKMPEQGSAAAAGYDIFACLDHDVILYPHKTTKIGTGLAAELPIDSWLGIFARSGLATKEGLRPANCVGVVDSDYRGEIIVAVHNDSNAIRTITPDEKIGQVVLFPKLNCSFEEVDELNDTERGTGGFGSTGK